MIEYLEIRKADKGQASGREIIGILDGFKSVIWNTKYYGVGDFEVYVECKPEYLELLEVGNYITRPDCKETAVIERIEIATDPHDGRVIIATGRMAKSLLDRRLIINARKLSSSKWQVSPTILRGNLEQAVRKVVSANAINPTLTERKIVELQLGTLAGLTETLADEKQTSYDNLLEFTDEVLEEYGLGAYVTCFDSSNKLSYFIYKGRDFSVDNKETNEPIIFSQDFDNLLASNYSINEANYKNFAYIGGEGEGLARFYSVRGLADAKNVYRREVFIDGASLSQNYLDENEVEQTLTDAEYSAQLQALGSQELQLLTVEEAFDGELDVNNSNYVFGVHFALGDIVTIEDIELGLYINARIVEATETQDENGFSVSVVYGK